MSIDYKYNEGEILTEIAHYVDSTYSQHYAVNKIEASQFIMDAGHGDGFFIGNILKYAQRYGKKGTREDARKDLMKVVHYAIMAIYNHDEKEKTHAYPDCRSDNIKENDGYPNEEYPHLGNY